MAVGPELPRTLLDELYADGVAYDAAQSDRLQRRRNLEPDAAELLRELADGSVDALFLDAERVEYESWWPDPVRVLRPGGLLIVDNVLSHPDEVVEISARIEADSSLRSTVVAVGKGELIAVKAG